MLRLWPTPGIPAFTDIELAAHYAYPEGLTKPYVRVNFVSSIDGAASVDGVSGGLGSAADKQVFGLLRELADVVLVGAGTARAENYRGARRPTRGTDTPPPIAVVTGSAQIDQGSPLLTDTRVPPLILTLASAPAPQRAALADAGAEIVVLDCLSPDLILSELARRGLYRVLCEGGPTLFGQLQAAGAVDELCLTVAPVLAAGAAGRIAHGPAGAVPRSMALAGAVLAADTLLLRYRSSPAQEPTDDSTEQIGD